MFYITKNVLKLRIYSVNKIDKMGSVKLYEIKSPLNVNFP